MQRVLIIGWDGATFDLIRPWVAQGKLPTLAKIMQGGAHGSLRSTTPPMTFPAWSSFMTGVNPGKHGIFDFTRPVPGKYELEFVNGGQRRAASVWRILSQAKRRVVSISVPCTYPPEHVNGVMISGFDAPGMEGRDSHVDPRGVYPPELYDELEEKLGGHPLGAFIANDINQGRPDLALERMLETVRRKAATAKYLMVNRPWDCLMILFGESDGAGHQFWKYCDPDSPLFQDHPAGMQDAILRVYQELDGIVAELMELMPEDTTLLMMSDHGFGGVSNWIVHPNCWLRDCGFLSFRGRAAHWKSRALEALKIRAVAMLPGAVKRLLYRLSQRRLGGIEARVRYSMIDWSGTQAYFEENPYYPVLWINLKGRQPNGTVEPGPQYEEVRNRLIDALEGWRHPETGERVVEKAYRREELYSGPCLSDAPDIIVQWGLHRGYNYAFQLSSKSPGLTSLREIDPAKPENLAFFTAKSGHHRHEGIFLAQGPVVREGFEVEGAAITDLAPTILHLLGVPVPENMDGRVLTEVFTEDYAGEVQVQADGSEITADEASRDDGYTAEDEEAISERLRSLGYIE